VRAVRGVAVSGERFVEKDVPDLYICPTTGETESRTLSGFDVCCDHPRCPGNLYGTTVTSPASTQDAER
jgi:hypothetical protein